MSKTPPNGGVRSSLEPDPATSAGIAFYHLTTTPLERALPKLVEKVYGAGHRILIIDSVPERLDVLNQVLWTYSTLTFLPHGSTKDPQPEEQPILLSAVIPAPAFAGVNSGGIHVTNSADVLIIVDGSPLDSPVPFTRILDIFDGNDQESLEKARARWKKYQAEGRNLMYLKQTDSGSWEEKKVA